MEYRPKPETAAWIQRERKRLKLSAAQLRERMRAFGVEVTEQTIRVWESNADRKPSPYNLDILERVFETRAPQKAGPATMDGAGMSAALIAALDRQSAAIEDLARTVREGQDRQAGSFDGLADGLLALLARLASEHAEPADGRAPRRVAKS